jgi:hypothetical protein
VWVLGSFQPASYADLSRVPVSTLFSSLPLAPTAGTSIPQTTSVAPVVEGPRVNWLNPAVSQGARPELDGAVILNGSNFLTVTQAGPARESNFSMYFDLVQNSSTGFLYAQSDSAGVLSLAVFSVAPTSTLFIIYSGATFNESQVAFAGVNLNDGRRHQLLLSFTPSSVSLRLDARAPQTKPLQGAVVDCGVVSASCIRHVGQRVSAVGSNSRLSGTLFTALWFPQASLAQYPSSSQTTSTGSFSSVLPSTTVSPNSPTTNLPRPLNLSGSAVLVYNDTGLTTLIYGLQPYSDFAILLRAINSAGAVDADVLLGSTDATLPSVVMLPIVRQRSATSASIDFGLPDAINGALVGYQASGTHSCQFIVSPSAIGSTHQHYHEPVDQC